MVKIAIDIAIIPPDFVLDTLININASMTDKTSENFNLGKKDFLPHITLLMGVIKEESLEEIKQKLNHVIKMHHSLSLVITEIYSKQKEDNTWHANALIQKSRELLQIHEDIINVVREFLIYESSPDMFYSFPKPDTNSNSLRWVKEYINTASFENFNPHISLGKGKISDNSLKDIKLPLSCMGTKIILAHLGTHCTCRKILFQVVLA